MQKPLNEACKEFVRTLILGIGPVIVLILSTMIAGIRPQTGEMVVNWSIVGATTIVSMTTLLSTCVTSATDKYKHEEGKLTDPNTKVSLGISPI